jgi:hypothetical protein
MKTLYLAKEPGTGVRSDLSRITDDLVVVDCLNAYGDYYRKKGYNCISRTEFFALEDMKFDVVIGNPPYQDTSDDKSSNLWTLFWVKALQIAKDDGVVTLITPATWLSPSKDFKSKAYGYEGDVRLWDTFNRFSSVADVDNISQHFRGVGSTFSRVTVNKSGKNGLSFVNGHPTEHGFLPKSNFDEVFSEIDQVNNLSSHFKMDQDHKPGLKVAVPMTRNFNKDPDKVQILQGTEVGTSASTDPRSYYYIYVNSLDQAERVKKRIVDCADILCNYCRWVGFLNLKVVELLKYNEQE